MCEKVSTLEELKEKFLLVKQSQHTGELAMRDDRNCLADFLKALDRKNYTYTGMRDYAIIVLMITGGLRTVEVTRANIGDIRNIGESTVLFIQGKGKIEKNDYVKLPDAVEKAIRTYLSSRKDDKSDTSPLFVSSSNNNNGKRLTERVYTH